MCGIMGYIGGRSAKNIVYNGLKQQEYRGYDSAGIALLDKELTITKAKGDTSNLAVNTLSDDARLGIGHTRWATHGKPSQHNAHPHHYGDVVLVHNGIIENYEQLKQLIDVKKLRSETDSEILAAVINHFYTKKTSLLNAVQIALAQAKGTFGIIAMSPREPDTLVAARRGSPVIIGVDDAQYYIASDPRALIDHTDRVIYLDDDQVAQISRGGLEVFDLRMQSQEVAISQLDEQDHASALGDFGSYLEKEIYEQPAALQNTMRGRVGNDGSIVLGGPSLTQQELQDMSHIVIVGCGTAYYAGYYAKYRLEEILGIPVSVEHASEFRYRYGAYKPAETLAIFISQSGETADTLASVEEAKRRGMMTMGIVNTVGSSLARAVDHGGIYLHVGVETSVASTKAFTAMVTALLMFGGFTANKLGQNQTIMRSLARELLLLPDEITNTLTLHKQIKKIASELHMHHDWYFLGRSELYPVALEGALKIAELAYVHAQAFPMGEMKHGPISLIDKSHVSVLLLPEDELLYEKGISNLQEIKARSGIICTISTRPKPAGSDYHIQVAHTGQHTDGLIMNVCLQLLALEVALKKDRNIDKPRNLAKSVTVE